MLHAVNIIEIFELFSVYIMINLSTFSKYCTYKWIFLWCLVIISWLKFIQGSFYHFTEHYDKQNGSLWGQGTQSDSRFLSFLTPWKSQHILKGEISCIMTCQKRIWPLHLGPPYVETLLCHYLCLQMKHDCHITGLANCIESK